MNHKDLEGIFRRLNIVYKELYDSGKVRHVTNFSAQLGHNRTSVKNYLKGDREPGVRFLRKLQNTFQVNINWVIEGKGDMFLEGEMKKERLKELLYQQFINDEADGYTTEQLYKIEDCVREMGEIYLKTYLEQIKIDFPQINPDIGVMNDVWFIEDKHIMRSVEMLVGAATETKIIP